MKIYVASSWRNMKQPAVVARLREEGHEVYDFRRPHDLNTGFSWSDIDPSWEHWSPEQFRAALNDPMAVDGFSLDMAALAVCEACVLVLPCGRSAHLELGYAVGAGKKTYVLLERSEPELMYRMCTRLVLSFDELAKELRN